LSSPITKRAKAALLHEFPATEFRGRSWLMEQPDWIVSGVSLEPSAYTRDFLIIKPLLLALFVPTDVLHFALPNALGPPRDLLWPENERAGDEALVSHVRQRVVPWLNQSHTPEALARALAKARTDDPYALEVGHAAWVMMRRHDDAARAFKRLAKSVHRDQTPWGDEILARAAALAAATEAEAAEMFEQRRESALAAVRF